MRRHYVWELTNDVTHYIIINVLCCYYGFPRSRPIPMTNIRGERRWEFPQD